MSTVADADLWPRDAAPDGLLDRIVVVDFGHMMQGPFAAEMLGDLGADVIKVERPGSGERQRQTGVSFSQGESLAFMAMNRNKRSIAIDLKAEEGLDIGRRLARRADIVIENFRPGVMERLGLGYQDLRADNPGLVYCSASGYGRRVADPNRPGQDLLAQALTGAMWLTGSKDDPPTPLGLFVADAHAATLLALGAVSALIERQRTGRGRLVEIDLIGAMLHLQTQEVATALDRDDPPARGPVPGHPHLEAPYGVYRAADGYLALSLIPIAELAEALEVPELVDRYPAKEDAVRDRDAMVTEVARQVATRPVRHWLDRLERRGLWCAPVLDHRSMLERDDLGMSERLVSYGHARADGVRFVRNPLSFDRSRLEPRRPPPLLAEHSAEILAELGYDVEQVAQLHAERVVDVRG